MTIDRTRRRFLGSAGLAGAYAATSLYAPTLHAAMGRPKRAGAGYGPLAPVRDRNTGLALLELPAGFSYTTFGWAGEAMRTDEPIPSAQDGMAVVAQEGDVVTLIRNHERVTDTGAFGPKSIQWDPVAGGGTVTLRYDLRAGKLLSATPSLAGTLQNCAGGGTPWGTWLSCEEYVYEREKSLLDTVFRPLDRLTREHGYVFEVRPEGGPAEPLIACGQLRHEAAVVHPTTGDVYLTEDRDPMAGFYRMRAAKRGVLAAGGVLEMLKVEGRRDTRTGLAVGQRLECSWVRIDEPDRGHSPGSRDGLGVFMQGYEQGGAVFTRGEGAYATADAIYFTCTNGGDARCGQLFAYRPADATLELVYQSPGREVLDYPDNIAASPRGGLVICEDGERAEMLLQGLSAGGELFPFARNVTRLDGAPYGHVGDYSHAEWAGVCYSKDGSTLFANAYSPGYTVAITGPWKRGLI